MRDHDPNTIREFLGTFDRGDDDNVPLGYFRDSRNIRFITNGVKSREGTTLDTVISTVRRVAIYKRLGEAQRLLILDAEGRIYDSINLASPILTIVAMTDFSMEVMFNRAYITPHNGQTGLPGEKVYVYEGSGVARPAGGSAPSGFTLHIADSASSGNCEVGIHIFAVCYITGSGYLTKPGGFSAFTPIGEHAVDVNLISVGPPNTIARQLVSTRSLTFFNGNYEDQEYFVIPNGYIPDNTSTGKTVSFYDADLVSSIDYVMDQLLEIPAGVGIRNCSGRLLVWGENTHPSLVRVSQPGQPESFDGVEGYLTVNPGDSGEGVKNVAEYRTQILLFKSERAYVTKDIGENAAYWAVDDFDTSVGTECHALARVRDFGDNLQDRLFIASRQGFHIFDGTFSTTPLSDPIDNIWGRITDSAFHTIECVIDPVEALIYVTVPLDGATAPTHLLVADYQEGFERIKWTTWLFPKLTQSIVVDVLNTKASVLKFGAPDGNVYRINGIATNDFGSAITAFIQFPHIPIEDEGDVYHFCGIRLRVKGSGALDIRIEGLDAVLSATPTSLVMTPTPGKELFRGFNFTNERCSVKLTIDGAGERFTLTKFVLFSKILWKSRAE